MYLSICQYVSLKILLLNIQLHVNFLPVDDQVLISELDEKFGRETQGQWL